jgi:hypothetical protein
MLYALTQPGGQSNNPVANFIQATTFRQEFLPTYNFFLMVAETSSCSTVVEVEIVRPLQNLTFTLTTDEGTCPASAPSLCRHRQKYLPVSFPLISILIPALGLKGAQV